MVKNIEQQVYELVRPYAGTYLFNHRKVELAPTTDLDTDLGLDELEAEDLMTIFFETFSVAKEGFRIENYYPQAPASWSLFKKTEPISVPDFTIGMLIESAKAGKWLYD
ncbi:DUF1493 family protein [Enterobacteriaceae bacterium 4M9]|nr:DUF1493 family protein [Enterobacteriaceae bacterium 4M9]